jgi:hypothetical protein
MIPPGYEANRFCPVSEASRQLIRRRLSFTKPTVLTLYAAPFDREDLLMHQVLKHPRIASCLGHLDAHEVRSLCTWTDIAQQLINLTKGRPTPSPFDDQTRQRPWNDHDRGRP